MKEPPKKSKKEKKQGQPMRALGPTEHCIWQGDKISRLNFITVAEVRGAPSRAHIQRALDDIQRRHPLFRAAVHARFRRPSFHAVEDAPIAITRHDGPVSDWVAIAEDRLDTWIDPSRAPLARFDWLVHAPTHSTIMLTFHHVIGDGISGAYVMRDLLEAIAVNMGESDSFTRPILPVRREIEAHVPAAIAARGMWRQFFARVGALLSWMWRHGKPKGPIADNPRSSAGGRKVCIIPRVIEPAHTQRIVDACRANQTTVHGALSAAIMLAACEEHGKPTPMLFASPVNVREAMEPAIEDDVGLFVSIGATLHEIDPGAQDFWELAREARQELRAFIDDGGAFTLLPMQNKALVWWARLLPASWFAGLVRRMQLPGVGLTNIGRADIASAYGALSIERLGFAVSLGVLGEFAVTAATLDGTLSLNFMAMVPTLTRTHCEALADRALAILEQHTTR